MGDVHFKHRFDISQNWIAVDICRLTIRVPGNKMSEIVVILMTAVFLIYFDTDERISRACVSAAVW